MEDKNHTKTDTYRSSAEDVGENRVEHLYRIHFAGLYHYGMSLCDDEELVKDCIQDLFVRLLAGRALLPQIEHTRSYLFVSLRHAVFAALDKHSQMERIDRTEKDFDVRVTDEELSHLFNRDDNALRMAGRLREAFRKLNANQRQALYLRFVKSFSWDEIGVVLHIAPHSCMNLVARAVCKLKELINS